MMSLECMIEAARARHKEFEDARMPDLNFGSKK